MFCCDDDDDDVGVDDVVGGVEPRLEKTRVDPVALGELTGDLESTNSGVCCCCNDNSFRRVCGVRPGPPPPPLPEAAGPLLLLF